MWSFVFLLSLTFLHLSLNGLRLQRIVFLFQGTAWSGWYSPPGIVRSNTSGVSAEFRKAEVKCDPPPSSPPECTRELGPCLFNIDNDPCEYVNQAKSQPDIVRNMLSWLEQYKQTMVPPRNKPNDPASNPNNFGGVWSPWMDGRE